MGRERAEAEVQGNKKWIWAFSALLLVGLIAFGTAGWREGTVPYQGAGAEEEALPLPEAMAPSALPDEVILDVPALAQRPLLPTGCELVSATMLLQYLGVSLTMEEVAQRIPYAQTPDEGYVGDPYGTGGYTIWPEPLASALSAYYPGLVGRTGYSLESLRRSLEEGIPVVVWVSDLHGFYLHSVLVTGYGPGVIYINDPWTGEKDVPLEAGYFAEIWEALDNRSLSL